MSISRPNAPGGEHNRHSADLPNHSSSSHDAHPNSHASPEPSPDLAAREPALPERELRERAIRERPPQQWTAPDPPDVPEPSGSRPVALIGILSFVLVALGFVVGYGFHTLQSTSRSVRKVAGSSATGPISPAAPVVKGLRLSPDGRLLAFTGVYDQSRRASRFVLDLTTMQVTAARSPFGWQDYITQWSPDGKAVLFEREKIPRPVDEDAKAGLYRQQVRLDLPQNTSKTPSSQKEEKEEKEEKAVPQVQWLTKDLAPPSDKVVSGFWTPEGRLVVKTKSEPKSLYEVRDGRVLLLDRSKDTYYQNRAVRENGKQTYYLVRDMPDPSDDVALYRLQGGRLRQLSTSLGDISWAYVAENGRYLMTCREAENGKDWVWSLYRITPQSAKLEKSAPVPGDAIYVYWSPDFKHILGASGASLWRIDVPSLRVTRLGKRTDWFADDATWMSDSQAVVVASNGRLWKVSLSGAHRELWKFPDAYWRPS